MSDGGVTGSVDVDREGRIVPNDGTRWLATDDVDPRRRDRLTAVIERRVDADPQFPLQAGRDRDGHRSGVVSVADIFEHVDAEHFEDKQTFHRAVGDAMRAGDFWEYVPGE